MMIDSRFPCRLGNLCGLLSPLLWWATILTSEAMLPGFDPVRMTISELAETGSPTADRMFVLAFLTTGAMNALFGVFLIRTFRPSRLAILLGLLVIVNGAARIGVGFHPCEPGCIATGRSNVQALHYLFAAIGFIAMISASGLASALFRRYRGTRNLFGYTVLSGVLGFACIAAMQWKGEALQAAGLLERLSSASLTLWMFVVALWLWRLRVCDAPLRSRA
jgi:hypothetical membrane protein